MRGTILVLMAAAVAMVVGAGGAGNELCADTEAMEVEIVVAPSVVYEGSKGTWITVHAEISYWAVSGVSVTLNGLPVKFTKADSRGELVAKFTLASVKDILVPGTNELTLYGVTKAGVPFEGTDDIRFIAAKSR